MSFPSRAHVWQLPTFACDRVLTKLLGSVSFLKVALGLMRSPLRRLAPGFRQLRNRYLPLNTVSLGPVACFGFRRLEPNHSDLSDCLGSLRPLGPVRRLRLPSAVTERYIPLATPGHGRMWWFAVRPHDPAASFAFQQFTSSLVH